MVSRTIPVDTFDLVIFGATGDLSRRKILPSLFKRRCLGQMPKDARIIGAARGKYTTGEFQEMVRAALKEFAPESEMDSKQDIEEFLSICEYHVIDAKSDQGWDELANSLRQDIIRAFYLSVGPSLFGDIAGRIGKFNMRTDMSRIVVEKPLGHDLASAKELNEQLGVCFDENQIYRIDHYLGKETVQNLMALRFANALFEPLWNSQYIDHVQITVSETIGVDGRGAYYDRSGAIRDMVQNHIMQLICLTAMEPPSQFSPDAVRDEKLKVIRALSPVSNEDIVRGQYRGIDKKHESYLEDVDNPNSTTESYIAIKTMVSNWRWAGTPFYIRTGKRLRARLSEIAVIFKDPPHSIFPHMESRRGNALIIRLQPDEGITLRMTIKEPGPGGMRLSEVPLDMTFAEVLGKDVHDRPNAYERLIMDVIRGDQTLFMSRDEVEAAWAWTDSVINRWKESGNIPSEYDSGGSGPEDSLMLMHRDGRRWREIGGQ